MQLIEILSYSLFYRLCIDIQSSANVTFMMMNSKGEFTVLKGSGKVVLNDRNETVIIIIRSPV